MRKIAMTEVHRGMGISIITRRISVTDGLSDFCAVAAGEILK
jgi:hypothetical protein